VATRDRCTHAEMLNLSRVVNLLFIVLDGSIFGARAVNLVYAASRGTRGVSFRAAAFLSSKGRALLAGSWKRRIREKATLSII